jgi:hypothetical protein
MKLHERASLVLRELVNTTERFTDTGPFFMAVRSSRVTSTCETLAGRRTGTWDDTTPFFPERAAEPRSAALVLDASSATEPEPSPKATEERSDSRHVGHPRRGKYGHPAFGSATGETPADGNCLIPGADGLS